MKAQNKKTTQLQGGSMATGGGVKKDDKILVNDFLKTRANSLSYGEQMGVIQNKQSDYYKELSEKDIKNNQESIRLFNELKALGYDPDKLAYEQYRGWISWTQDFDISKYKSKKSSGGSMATGGRIITLDDGFQFQEVGYEYAKENWDKESIYEIRESEQSESLIESESDINPDATYGIEIGFEDAMAKGGGVVSDCCGATPQSFAGPHGTPDSDSTDHGRCPKCKEPCEFVNADI